MKAALFRVLFWGVIAAILIAGLVYAFIPRPLPVDLSTIEKDRITVAVTDEGKAEVREIYRITAPVAGRLMRVGLEVGDKVKAGATELARIEPSAPVFLDVRTEAEARAAVEVAKAAKTLADAEWKRAQAEEEFTSTELERSRSLFTRGTVPKQRLDEAERAYRVAAADLLTAQARRDQSQHELEVAEAKLVSPTAPSDDGGSCECLVLRAPVDGEVLQVIEESETSLAPGNGIIEIGDPKDLQIRVDLLSEDAVLVKPGLAARVDGWGGGPLRAVVRRVEPFGYTKVSALGIEEQRVDVLLDIADPAEEWKRLGHGYRVDVSIFLHDVEDLAVPTAALFRSGTSWAVFQAVDGKAVLRTVELGHRNAEKAQVLGGLAEGDAVIMNPPDTVAEGSLIEMR
ncbi:HlyD family efflux transporter periplasmic adaptor subunit [Hwanghaeella grinnelliae]|uniref:HlyD family efflux transporter periplasmic adaptor subunit n=1 Tax=Hwanghaeella grinnelliae TaxID=2500179 RepID=A0A437QWS2_9PROT|nr:HlyD family efflux transporter periplasmic adaptor subunit [Hwanghaeella grinnelliae]RVU38961.1 HlyD family efflux transporter periplasmic adaptor subunit [Hwanghaeella grinnelliae]